MVSRAAISGAVPARQVYLSANERWSGPEPVMTSSAHSTGTGGLVYKILGEAEWQTAVRTGLYAGSADDARDGYIHLSAADQVAGTAARHFGGRTDLVLVALDVALLGSALKWERSRGGALFPHLYGPIDPAAAVSVTPLPLGPNGMPELPEGIEE